MIINKLQIANNKSYRNINTKLSVLINSNNKRILYIYIYIELQSYV